MIIIVLGMHKSGTTLIAKTLHESGIHMGVDESGDYPKIKYEDPEISRIIKLLVHGKEKRHSLELPKRGVFSLSHLKSIGEYVDARMKKHGYFWGFKFPDVTLCYDLIKPYLPEQHIAIGVKRNRNGIINHYMNKQSQHHSIDQINKTTDEYEKCIDNAGVDVIQYEEFLEKGPSVLNKVIPGLKFKDCRRRK